MLTTVMPYRDGVPQWTPLLTRVAAGDGAAIARLYSTLEPLKSFLRKRLGPDDAEDAFHSVITVLLGQLQRGMIREPERLLGYLYAITRRYVAAVIGEGVRARNRGSCDGMEIPSRDLDIQTRLERAELKDIARRVLAAMPVRDREILIRFYLREERPKEIEGTMGITETQFRLAKSRAKARFGELCREAAARKPAEREAGRDRDCAPARLLAWPKVRTQST